MPSKGICFLSFEWIKDLLCRGKSSLSNFELLVAGAAAGAVTEVGASHWRNSLLALLLTSS
eukprot:scaffold250172_cov46-Prasinocladus_malaysianus.AAC.1